MGYRIDYQPGGQYKRMRKRRTSVLITVAAMCALLVILACVYPGNVRILLLELIFPGDAALTIASFDNLVEEMKTGTSFADAFRLFCRQVISG